MKFTCYLPLIIILFTACNKKAENTAIDNINISEEQKFPIIMIDPNINAWSGTPTLYSSHLQHPDGKELPLVGIIRVDGKTYRFMGSGKLPDKALAGMSSDVDWNGKYTFIKPADGWENMSYNDNGWDSGKAPFGKIQNLKVNTIWPSPAIWLRREMNITPNDIAGKKLYLKYSHDDEVQIFVNGIELLKTGFEWKYDAKIEIPDHIIETFKDGKIVIAAFCKNLTGEAFLDFGIYFQAENNRDKWSGKYTFSQPSEDWLKYDYNDETWDIGDAPFGTSVDYRINTEWKTKDIWVRREIELSPEELDKSLLLNYSYDDNLTLFINGVQIVQNLHQWQMNKTIEIPEKIKENIIDGKLVVAAHCKNKSGGAYLDFNILAEDIAKQKSVEITATQTHYTFQCGEVELNLHFTSPLLLDDIEIMSRPINYISYDVASLDDKEHQVELYIEATPAWASNGTSRTNTTEIYEKGNLLFLKTGLTNQKILDVEDNTKEINWGYFYMCTENSNASAYLGDAFTMRAEFVKNGIVLKDTINKPSAYMSIVQSLGRQKQSSGKIMVGYDDIYSIQYFGENLRPYWNRNGNQTIERLFEEANNDFNKTVNKCTLFNDILLTQTAIESGLDYATFSATMYRQLITKNKLAAGLNSDCLLFCEGDIMDIRYSLSLYKNYNVDLLKAQLDPIFHYCESDKWQKNYPPTNLGQYPLANGQTMEFDIPLEAASNLLTICADIAAIEDNAEYVQKHWATLTKWHDYLINYTISNQATITGTKRKELANISTIVMTGISSYTYMAKILKK